MWQFYWKPLPGSSLPASCRPHSWLLPLILSAIMLSLSACLHALFSSPLPSSFLFSLLPPTPSFCFILRWALILELFYMNTNNILGEHGPSKLSLYYSALHMPFVCLKYPTFLLPLKLALTLPDSLTPAALWCHLPGSSPQAQFHFLRTGVSVLLSP